MPVKPSENEEEYFLRQEVERRRKAAEEHRAHLEAEERQRAKELHYMKCPKCGMDLEEIGFGGVQVDKCFSCGGMFLDDGELEKIESREPGFAGRLLGLFKTN